MNKKEFFLDTTMAELLIDGFPNDEIGAVICALINYINKGEKPKFTDRAMRCLFYSLLAQHLSYINTF